MSGCRALNDIEVIKVLENLTNRRDRCLFILGLKTGFRITELLSLRVVDVYQDGMVLDRVKVAKSHMKSKRISRQIVLHPEAKQAIKDLVLSMVNVTQATPLFRSSTNRDKILSRFGAAKVLKVAYEKAGLTGTHGELATHTMRKSFAQKVYKNLKFNIVATQKALGHTDFTNTIKYLSVDSDEVDRAILAG